MPLLAYFGVVGTVLVGLLFVAEARLGPPTSLSISTNFHGLPQPYKAASAPILTARDAPAPEIADTQPAVSDNQPLKIVVTKATSAPKPKRPAKIARKADRNLFAAGPAVPGKSHGVW